MDGMPTSGVPAMDGIAYGAGCAITDIQNEGTC
jgi:hypothetical protein